MAKDFKVIVNDPEQRSRFVEVFGTNVVCVEAPIPCWADLPIGVRKVFLLDMAEIDPDQRSRLVANIAGRFKLSVADVERDLETMGCPILADYCTLIVEHPARWLE